MFWTEPISSLHRHVAAITAWGYGSRVRGDGKLTEFNFLSRHAFAISPRVSREVCFEIPALHSEGAGNAGRPMRPQPRVVYVKHAR
jgi:hypothetical protein